MTAVEVPDVKGSEPPPFDAEISKSLTLHDKRGTEHSNSGDTEYVTRMRSRFDPAKHIFLIVNKEEA
jgi:hypothetical protein